MGFPVPLERDIQRQLLDWLTLWGAFPIRVNSAAVKVADRYFRANSQPGCSDILCVLPDGRFGAIEAKRPGEKPTAKQASFLAAVKARGGFAAVADSLDALRAALAAEGYRV